MSLPFIVAEVSANHSGSLKRALQIIDAAKESGADGVKFQTFRPDEMVGDDTATVERGTWAGHKLIDLYREAQTPYEWHPALFERCLMQGMVPFSTPFSVRDVEFLESIRCPIYKVASFEITDLELIRAIADTHKPIIISTGMANFEEIERAVDIARSGGEDVTLLKCTSAYPASVEDANLSTLDDMRLRFGCDVGVSDHTLGLSVAVAAVALGASFIEKHFTLCRSDGGPDSSFSMEPDEFRRMAHACKEAAQAIGSVRYGGVISEMPELRRSWWFSTSLQEGEVVERRHLKCARPAIGVPADQLHSILGKKINRPVAKGEPVRWEMLIK